MNPRKTWLIDFDETLASGSITWAFQSAFPKFIQAHHLRMDNERLARVMLVMQERTSQSADYDPAELVEELFEQMEWPAELAQPLLQDLFENYQPALFDDALPFLQRLREKQQRIFVLSNNPRTPRHIRLIEIDQLVERVLTPDTCPDTFPKPHRSLWDFIVANEVDIDPANTVVVGDDPWSDGSFAEACGLDCWLVDRLSRFSALYSARPYQWVRSLDEISV